MRNLWTTLAGAGVQDRRISSHARHVLFLNTIVLLILFLILQNLLLVAYYDVATLPVTGVLVAHFRNRPAIPWCCDLSLRHSE